MEKLNVAQWTRVILRPSPPHLSRQNKNPNKLEGGETELRGGLFGDILAHRSRDSLGSDVMALVLISIFLT